MAYSLKDFAAFCGECRLESGEPLKLHSYERQIVGPHFDGVRETLIVIPKKNGKTTLMAALSLFHLLEWPDAECVVGASSRDQARILYRQAAGLARRSSYSRNFDAKPGFGEIRLQGQGRDGPRVRVLAADANTADGVIPTLALVDELHRHPSAELYGLFLDGLGPRDGRMITISTAGATLDSPLGLIRAAAYQLPSFRRDSEKKHTFVTSEDGAFVMHEWCLDPEDDVDDMAVVKLANPAPWQTVAMLKERRGSPSMTPWRWKRFACGIWTEGEEPWILPAMWDVLGEDGLEVGDGPCWLGVDIGVKHDSTAIAVVTPLEDGRLAVTARILKPPTGGALSLEVVEREIRELCESRDVQAVMFDPWTFRRSAELLEAEGLPMVEFPQSPERMSNASENLYRLIDSGELVHDRDPVLRSHVMAGVTKETERGWRLVKDPKLSRPIDALIALSMACLPAAVGQGGYIVTFSDDELAGAVA